MPYRRLPSLLCRRFPNRQGVVNSEIVGKWNGSQAGSRATQQTKKSAVRFAAASPTFNRTLRNTSPAAALEFETRLRKGVADAAKPVTA